ncbi:MAG: glycosyltransferase family 2 protein [Actinobacteria bacterium]|nr:glycosyltransferase family 2 protein [Actinomycetota bacterium]MBU1609333.1 glycosyltransferase family 2 protein [Actinomycetota bacterium]MBU2314965.1 glycosyltransferase family 2 protein [Actinomycetota bacterium]MBU2385069.1 glycosyltransferase family 2 protein [Actinomycetota bacterium]
MASRPELTVVAPCFREGPNVPHFVEIVSAILDEHCSSWEIVLVDDGSPDDTWIYISEAAKRLPGQVRGLRLSRNFGKESALVAGLDAARGRAVVTIDADLQHPPSAIPEMIEHWRQGAQVVHGVKMNRPGQGWVSRTLSRVFNDLFTRMTSVDLNSATDFKLLDRRALEGLQKLNEVNVFYRGTASWIGFRQQVVRFEVSARAHGSSAYSFPRLFRLALSALTSFTPAPLHLVTFSGVAFGLFAVVLGIQTFIRFLLGDAVPGFTTTILLSLVLGSLVLTGLGVIGEYLARIHDEVKGRPRYLLSEET